MQSWSWLILSVEAVFLSISGALGTMLLRADCDGNGREGSAAIPSEGSPDCNENGTPDACDIRAELSFAAPAVHELAGQILSLGAADLDGDGLLDLFGPNGGGVEIALNAGEGRFSTELLPSTTGGAQHATAADLDGDGDFDLAVTSVNSPLAFALFNEGRAGFGPPLEAQVEDDPAFVGAADLDGDSRIDLVVVNRSSASVSILKNRGNRSFHEATSLRVGVGPTSVALADFDVDGDIDATVSNSLFSGGGSVSLLLNDGMDLAPSMEVDGPRGAVAALADDMNLDGRPDLVVGGAAEAGEEGGDVRLLSVDGQGSLGTWARIAAPEVSGLAAADLDGDTVPDLIVAGARTGNLSTFWNSGHGEFRLLQMGLPGGSPAFPVPGDLDEDGDVDLAIGLAGFRQLTLHYNRGDGTFAFPDKVRLGIHPRDLACADFNGDGLVDLASLTHDQRQAWIFLHEGRGLRAASTRNVSSNAWALEPADVDADGDVDVVVALFNDLDNVSEVLVLRNSGVAAFEEAGAYTTDVFPSSIAAGDLDSDGDTDLMTANLRGQSLTFLWNEGSAFRSETVRMSAAADRGIVLDVDGDGDVDAAFVGEREGQFVLGVLRNDEGNTWTETEGTVVNLRALSLKAADLDLDGSEDIVAAGFSPPAGLAITWNRGDGVFEEVTMLKERMQPSGLGVSDLDGDGLPELVAANGPALAVVHEVGTRRFLEKRYLTAARSGIEDLVLLDLEGDGDSDILAGANLDVDLHILENHSRPARSMDANDDGVPDECEEVFIRCDANTDGRNDIADALWIVNMLFRQGPRRVCERPSDCNDDGEVDLPDAIYIIRYQLQGGPSPPHPFPACGNDPIMDDLSCPAGSVPQCP